MDQFYNRVQAGTGNTPEVIFPSPGFKGTACAVCRFFFGGRVSDLWHILVTFGLRLLFEHLFRQAVVLHSLPALRHPRLKRAAFLSYKRNLCSTREIHRYTFWINAHSVRHTGFWGSEKNTAWLQTSTCVSFAWPCAKLGTANMYDARFTLTIKNDMMCTDRFQILDRLEMWQHTSCAIRIVSWLIQLGGNTKHQHIGFMNSPKNMQCSFHKNRKRHVHCLWKTSNHCHSKNVNFSIAISFVCFNKHNARFLREFRRLIGTSSVLLLACEIGISLTVLIFLVLYVCTDVRDVTTQKSIISSTCWSKNMLKCLIPQ